MNLNKNIPVIIREDDYDLLKPYFTRSGMVPDEMSLSAELGRASIVKKNKFPAHAIRINSRVQILDQETGASRDLCIVMPQDANIKENKVSIISPIGAALIGFRKGDTVQWEVPAGLKQFRITEVHNEQDS
jgi:regulator of nucleoside diphosphate kinase